MDNVKNLALEKELEDLVFKTSNDDNSCLRSAMLVGILLNHRKDVFANAEKPKKYLRRIWGHTAQFIQVNIVEQSYIATPSSDGC